METQISVVRIVDLNGLVDHTVAAVQRGEMIGAAMTIEMITARI